VQEAERLRSFYLKALTVRLVLLVAATFTVVLRPLGQLVIHVGALVLGISGMRSILVGPPAPTLTAVDLWLSLVMLFLLVAIAVPTFAFLDARSGLSLLPPFRARPPAVRTIEPHASAVTTPPSAPTTTPPAVARRNRPRDGDAPLGRTLPRRGRRPSRRLRPVAAPPVAGADREGPR
jgi:hypothetical protein